jgi:hypothetical protein
MTTSTAPPLTTGTTTAELRVLSVRLPWSWWMLHPHPTLGLKQFENRGWTHNYRGKLWIHANKWEQRPPAGLTFCEMTEEETKSLWREVPLNDGPLSGHIIGCVDLVASADQHDIEECYYVMAGQSRRKLTPSQDQLREHLPPTDDEQAWKWWFGDGALVVKNPRVLEHPIPTGGKLGIWKFNANPASLTFRPSPPIPAKPVKKRRRTPK